MGIKMKFLKFKILLTLLITMNMNSYSSEVIPDNSAYINSSSKPHEMRIINSGIASLYSRIDMIRRAQKSIELETFIFNPDTAGRLILKELIAAAKRGVKVRVLIDKASFNLKLNEYHAQALKKLNVDVRYYNDSSNLNIGSVQYRNHRKLMVIDDKEAITGGRNYADEYFDLSKDLNFHDRDATIEGELVKKMRESFDKFWSSDIVETPKAIREPIKSISLMREDVATEEFMYARQMNAYNAGISSAQSALAPNEKDEKILKFVFDQGKKVFLKNKKHFCPQVTFATDREGAGVKSNFSKNYKRDFRYLTQTIVKWVNEKANKELTIDTPYYLRNKLNELINKNISEKGIKINVFTNSLASTDAIHVASVFNDTINDFTPNANFNAYVYKGKYSQEEPVLYSEEIRKATWGTHSKSMVFNDDSFMIGSFNLDNRSVNFNSELGLFCSGSKELTADVLSSIKLRISKSYHLDASGNPDDCSNLLGDVTIKKKSIYYLLKIPSRLIESLL